MHRLANKCSIIILFALLILPITIFAQVNSDDDPDIISVTGDATFAQLDTEYHNRNAELSYNFFIRNRSGQPLLPTSGSFVITLPGAFQVPATIPTSGILIDGVPATTVSVTQTGGNWVISAQTPQEYNGATPSITIHESAGIVNPVTEGSYTIDLSLDGAQTTGNAGTSVGSIQIEIEEVESTVSTASITPSSSIADLRSRYRIEFSLGDGGRLPSGSSIILHFDPATTIPSGGMEGISINGTPINQSSAIGNGSSTITITTPVAYANSANIDINISRGAGIRNPSTPGIYTGGISTTSEPTVVLSSPISYSDPVNLSFSAIELTDSQVNALSGYEIEFITGSNSALFGGSDKIVFEFPENTLVPQSINTSNILISTSVGFSDQPNTIITDPANRKVEITVPFDIPGGTEVITTFSSTAGLENPSQAVNPLFDEIGEANYRLQAYTLNVDSDTVDSKTPSNPYSIVNSSSTINSVEVALSSYQQNETNVDYTITFQTGSLGRIEGGYSGITIRFPSGTELPANVSTLPVTVNSVSASNIEPSGDTGREIFIPLPEGVNIGNNQSVEVVVGGITNPGDDNIKNVRASTTAEPSLIETGNYQLGDFNLSVTSTTVSSNLVNATNQQYTIELNGGGNFNLGGSTGSVYIRFPNGSVLPDVFATNNVTLAGTFNTINSVTKVDSRTIRIDITRNGNNDATVGQVTVNTSAGIGHPSIPGDYNVSVWTSNAANPIAGPNYTLNSRSDQVSGVSASSNPNVESFSGATYQINFTTSANGRIIGGTSNGSNQILVQFPGDYSLPASIASSSVTVNGSSSSGVSVNTGTGVITVGVPNGMTIDNNSSAQVVFTGSAGISNPLEGSYNIGVQTDVNAGGFVTDAVNITGDADLTITSFSLSQTGTNDVASYVIRFRSGSTDVVSSPPDGIIELVFDEKVGLPSGISTNRVTINGQNANAVAISGSTISITVPEELAANTEHRINISSLAGIINPYDAGEYEIGLFLPEPNSSTQTDEYTITKQVSTISQPSVSVLNTTEMAETDYTVSFNTGSNGRLASGSSTITVAFPAEVDLSSLSTITINGQAVTASTVNAQSVEMTVPNGINIRNSSSVSIVFESIENPDEPGSYTLDVHTSIETTSISSSAFFIGSSGISVNAATFELYDPDDQVVTEVVVNTPPSFSINFIGSEALDGSNEILIRFPEDTQFGSSPSSEIIIETADGDLIGTFEQIMPVSTADRNNRILRYSVDVPLPAGTEHNLQFVTISDLTNPREPTNSESNRYEITSSLTPDAFTAMPSFEIISAPASYSTISNLKVFYGTSDLDVDTNFRWQFNVGNYGALKNNVARIYLQFADNVALPETILEQDVNFIDGNTGFNPVSVTVADQLVTLVLPSGVTVGNGDEIIIEFDADAGIQRTSAEVDPQMSQRNGQNVVMNEVMDGHSYAASTSAENEFVTGDESVLPVELIEFVVTESNSLNSLYPQLVWSTATEKDNYGFDIYRKYASENDWEHIGFVEGAGTIQTKQNYQYTDQNVAVAGFYLYKIVQTDYDGTTAEYGPVEYFMNAPEKFQLSQNYPNPFNPVTTIPFDVPHQTDVVMNVYDILGRRVQVLVNEQMQPGSYNMQFDASRFASGTYFVRMVADGQVFTRKIMLIK